MKKELWVMVLGCFCLLWIFFYGVNLWVMMLVVGTVFISLRQVSDKRWWGCILVVLSLFALRIYREQVVRIFPADREVTGSLMVDCNHVKINGDSVTGIAEFDEGVADTELTASAKGAGHRSRIFFSLRLTSREEQHYWQNLSESVVLDVGGKFVAIEGARNKGSFDAKQYYRSKGIQQWLQVEKYTLQRVDSSLLAMLSHWRNFLVRQVLAQPDTAIRSYALLLVFGERSQVDPTIIEQYQQLSIMHLLAISGLHITLIIHLLQALLWRSGCTRERSAYLIMGILLVFGWLMDWNVSGMRAIGMYMITYLARVTGKRISQLDSLCLVWLLAILYRPSLCFGVAFQLSYGLTFIVLLVSAFTTQQWSVEWQQHLLTPLLTIFVALPLICHYFYCWNVLSLVLTGALVWLFERLLLPAVFCYVGCIWLQWTVLVQGISVVVNHVLSALHGLLAYCEQLPGVKWTFGRWSCGEWMLYWGMLLLLAIMMEQRWGNSAVRETLLCLSLVVLVFVPYHWGYEMVMLDIGQGDAILLLAPGWNQATLIDTGGEVQFAPREGWRKRQRSTQAQHTLIPALQAEGLSNLAQIMLSHADYDHIGNLPDLLQVIPCQQMIVAQGMQELPSMQQLQQNYPTIQWRLVTAGSHWQAQKMQWQILSPSHRSNGENQDSLIALVTAENSRILLTGDAPSSVEEQLVKQYPNLHIDILKVGHHGSKTSTSEALLSVLQPQYALISAGKNNRYHHPHAETLQRLAEHHVYTLVTNEQGAIRLWLDTHQLEITTSLNEDDK